MRNAKPPGVRGAKPGSKPAQTAGAKSAVKARPKTGPKFGAKPGPKAKFRPGAKALTGPSQRQLRAGELVRHALAEILREEEVQDPALAGVSVTVTEVRTSPDLRHATVFVEPLGAGLGPRVVPGLASGVEVGVQAIGAARVAEMVAALNRAAGFLRGRLGHAIALKFTPSLNFVHDESFDAAAHMNALFADPRVARDIAPVDTGYRDDETGA